MRNNKKQMIFTSFSIPNWQIHRLEGILPKILDQTLYSLIEYCVNKYIETQKFKMPRSHAAQYNKSPSKYEKISVYWDVDFYNRIRMKAHHDRISASLLIHLALLIYLVDSLKNSREKNLLEFCSYQNFIVNSNNSTISIIEKLLYLHPPDN